MRNERIKQIVGWVLLILSALVSAYQQQDSFSGPFGEFFHNNGLWLSLIIAASYLVISFRKGFQNISATGIGCAVVWRFVYGLDYMKSVSSFEDLLFLVCLVVLIANGLSVFLNQPSKGGK